MKEVGEEHMQEDQKVNDATAWTQTCCRDWNANSRRWGGTIGTVQGNYCIICLIVLQGEDAQFARRKPRAELFGDMWPVFL